MCRRRRDDPGGAAPVLPNRNIWNTQDRSPKRISSNGWHRHRPIRRCVLGTGLRAAIGKIGLPPWIKTAASAMNGKGQAIIRDGDDPDKVWEDLGTKSAILEAFIAFEREISVSPRAPPARCRMFRRHRKRTQRPHLKVSALGGGAIPECAGGAGARDRGEDRAGSIMSACSRSRCLWYKAIAAEGSGQRDRTAGA